MYSLLRSRPIDGRSRAKKTAGNNSRRRRHHHPAARDSESVYESTHKPTTTETTTRPRAFSLKSTSRPEPERECHESDLIQPPVPKRFALCQCCYEEIQSTMTSCSTGEHKFCADCVKTYVKAWVFGQSYQLRDSQNGRKLLPCLSSNCTDGMFTTDLVAQVCTTPEELVFRDAYVTQQDLVSYYSEISAQVTDNIEGSDDATVVSDNRTALLSWRQ